VRANLQEGIPTGPWIPLCNDCNTWVRDVINDATPTIRNSSINLNEGEFPQQHFSDPHWDERTVVYPDGSVRVVVP